MWFNALDYDVHDPNPVTQSTAVATVANSMQRPRLHAELQVTPASSSNEAVVADIFGTQLPQPIPKEYSDEFVNAFCSAILEGHTIHSLCKLDGIPNRADIYRLFQRHPAFLNAYCIARQMRAEARADRIDEISRAMANGTLDVEVGKAMVSNEKWLSSKEWPSKYSEHRIMDVTTTNTHEVTVTQTSKAPTVDWSTITIDGELG